MSFQRYTGSLRLPSSFVMRMLLAADISRGSVTMSSLLSADDPELAEFLRVMAPRSKTATWANDDAVPAAAKPGSVKTGRGRRVGTGSAKEAMADGEAERKDLLGAIVQGGNSRVYSEPEDDATADGESAVQKEPSRGLNRM